MYIILRLMNLSIIRTYVDPPGLEPGLCGTKIRRVTNYTMGHYYSQFSDAKIEKNIVIFTFCGSDVL